MLKKFCISTTKSSVDECTLVKKNTFTFKLKHRTVKDQSSSNHLDYFLVELEN